MNAKNFHGRPLAPGKGVLEWGWEEAFQSETGQEVGRLGGTSEAENISQEATYRESIVS